MSDAQKTWVSILHFARTGKSYGKAVPNMDAAIYAGDRIDALEKQVEALKAENTRVRTALGIAAKDYAAACDYPLAETEALSDWLRETPTDQEG